MSAPADSRLRAYGDEEHASAEVGQEALDHKAIPPTVSRLHTYAETRHSPEEGFVSDHR